MLKPLSLLYHNRYYCFTNTYPTTRMITHPGYSMAIVVSNVYLKSKDAYPCFELMYMKRYGKDGSAGVEKDNYVCFSARRSRSKRKGNQDIPFWKGSIAVARKLGQNRQARPQHPFRFHCGVLKHDVAPSFSLFCLFELKKWPFLCLPYYRNEWC